MTTFVLSMFNSNLVDPKGTPAVLGLALFYGGRGPVAGRDVGVPHGKHVRRGGVQLVRGVLAVVLGAERVLCEGAHRQRRPRDRRVSRGVGDLHGLHDRGGAARQRRRAAGLRAADDHLRPAGDRRGERTRTSSTGAATSGWRRRRRRGTRRSARSSTARSAGRWSRCFRSRRGSEARTGPSGRAECYDSEEATRLAPRRAIVSAPARPASDESDEVNAMAVERSADEDLEQELAGLLDVERFAPSDAFRAQALLADPAIYEEAEARLAGLVGPPGRAAGLVRAVGDGPRRLEPAVLQVVRRREAERVVQLRRPPRPGRAGRAGGLPLARGGGRASGRSPTPTSTATSSASPTPSRISASRRATSSGSSCR